MNSHTQTPESFDKLRASIEEHGVLVPLFVTPGGTIIDGHHRAQILLERGVPRDEWPMIVWPPEVPDHVRRRVANHFRIIYERLTSEDRDRGREHDPAKGG